MPDILIRNVPPDDVERLDQHAQRLGLSRHEYLRRRLHQDAQRRAGTVTAGDFAALTDLLPDLADADLMREAWS